MGLMGCQQNEHPYPCRSLFSIPKFHFSATHISTLDPASCQAVKKIF